jgi:hypothetical protein
MEHSARIFNCARCHRQVIICSCCDRGNIYCSSECSLVSRQESVRAAGKRYQKTYRGKLHHAERQKRYRKQKIIKVTHQGSPNTANNDLLQSEANEFINIANDNEIRCHFCGCICDSLLRIEFLARSKTHITGIRPLGS